MNFQPKSEYSRNILTLMTGTTVSQAIPIAISPILTRIYTPEDFGVFALFIALTAVFSSIVTGRYELAIMLPEKDEDAINIFVLGVLITLIISLLLLLIVFVFHQELLSVFNNKAISPWLYFLPLSVFIIGLFNTSNYFNNRKKYYKDMSNAKIQKAFYLAVLQIGIGVIKTGALGLIIGQMLSQFLMNVQLMKNINKEKDLLRHVNKVKIFALARRYQNFPKFQSSHVLLNTLLFNLPVYIMSSFFTVVVVGFYALSIRIVFSPLVIVSSSMAQVYNQRMTELFVQDRQAVHGFTLKVLKSLLKKISLPFILIVAFAPEIFAFVFGEMWREAGVYTQILSPWILLNTLVSVISFVPSLIDGQKKALKVSLIHFVLLAGVSALAITYEDIYIFLSLFMFANCLVLLYNLNWFLQALKTKENAHANV